MHLFIQFMGRKKTCRDETEANGGHLQGPSIKRNHDEEATKEDPHAQAMRGAVNWLIEGPDVKCG